MLVAKKLCHLCNVPRLNHVWSETISNFIGTGNFRFANDVVYSSCSSYLCFFKFKKDTSRRNSFNTRKWTNILLAYLLLWGAKKGQTWRLATYSLLHANVRHLMVNCYSLNSVGPTVENLSGSRRFLAVYLASAISSAATSYWFCKAPAVGASGAIFGLVGSVAVFVMRHRGMIRDAKEDLQHIAQVIFLNMVIGLMSRGIDNWDHLGGSLGGAAVSWLVGPA
ncbi:hypothetical protein V6Z12_A01G202000 [Gossypium hirsutum]